MTDRQIDDTATQIGDCLYAHLSPIGAVPCRIADGLTTAEGQRPISHELTCAEMTRFAVEVGHAAFGVAQRLLQERDTAERDARNAEATS